jgi:zinc transport system substrate-binding protein
MPHISSKTVTALATTTLLMFATQTLAHDTKSHDASPEHAHSHEVGQDIDKGYFEDSQIKDRPLSDWAGAWQSVYPYLQDGTLAPVMQHKADQGDKTADAYHSYYDTGYKTDVNHIDIDGNTVRFVRDGTPLSAQYESDGYEVLTYAKGNRGVRYIFEKTDGDDAAPAYIQFSDHRISPESTDHYHLYWGNDRAALLKDVTNWPTYYPASMDGDAIVHDMLTH